MSKSKLVARRPDMRLVVGVMLVFALAGCKKDNTTGQAGPAAAQQATQAAAPPPVAVSAEVAAMGAEQLRGGLAALEWHAGQMAAVAKTCAEAHAREEFAARAALLDLQLETQALGAVLDKASEQLAQMEGVAFGTVRIDPDIVDIEDIDAVEAKARMAEFHRAHDAVIAVVVAHIEGQRIDIAVVRHLVVGDGNHDAADLAGQHVASRRLVAQEIAGAAFGKAEAVPRGGIEIAQALVPGRIQRRHRHIARAGAV